MEMLNAEFDSLRQDESCPDLYPAELQVEIDQLNDQISDSINIGVYKCAFAPSQASKGFLACCAADSHVHSAHLHINTSTMNMLGSVQCLGKHSQR